MAGPSARHQGPAGWYSQGRLPGYPNHALKLEKVKPIEKINILGSEMVGGDAMIGDRNSLKYLKAPSSVAPGRPISASAGATPSVERN